MKYLIILVLFVLFVLTACASDPYLEYREGIMARDHKAEVKKCYQQSSRGGCFMDGYVLRGIHVDENNQWTEICCQE